MGELVDLAAARARRGPDDVWDVVGARLTWDAGRRLIELAHRPGHELDEAQGLEIGQAVLRWVGEVPGAPYGFLVRGAAEDDQGSPEQSGRIGRLR